MSEVMRLIILYLTTFSAFSHTHTGYTVSLVYEKNSTVFYLFKKISSTARIYSSTLLSQYFYLISQGFALAFMMDLTNISSENKLKPIMILIQA